MLLITANTANTHTTHTTLTTHTHTLTHGNTCHNFSNRVKDVELFPCVLVGTKLDLESQRQVITAEGEELAEKLQCPFFEISCMVSFFY